jgi:hypothetical protein
MAGRSAVVGAVVFLLVACQGVSSGPPSTGPVGTTDGGDGGPAPDSGTGTLDGGVIPDAGNPEPTICTEAAPGGVCVALAPPVGVPVAHQYLERLDGGPGENVFCGNGRASPASGSGVVLHPVQVQGAPPSLTFIDRSGQGLGTFGQFASDTFQLDVVAQDTGFGILDRSVSAMGSYGLVLVDDHGKDRGGPELRQGSSVAPLPGGAVALFRFQDGSTPDCPTQAFVRKYGDDGRATLPDWTDLGCYPQGEPTAIAGNSSGNVLLLVASAGESGWDAAWLDSDLLLVARFSSPELASEPNDQEVAIAALLDGSFVLRLGGQWKYRVQPGASTLEAAPCWLTSRPVTDLVPIRGGSAYAVIHRGSEECDRAVEVLTPEGRTCGLIALDGTDGPCDMAVGRDGTVSKSPEAVVAGTGEPRACVLEFWPAALGPSGF